MAKNELLVTGVFFLAILAICSCNRNSGPDSNHDWKPKGYDADENVSEAISPYIGLSESEAKKLAESEGRQFRVLRRDEEDLFVTADYNSERINVEIEKGVVVFGRHD